MMTRIPRVLIAASLVMLSLAACSILPARGHPPEVEFRVSATYEFSDHPPDAVQVPASGDDLVVLELTTEPDGLLESFRGGKRFLHLPNQCRILRLRCHYRIYGQLVNSPGLPDPRSFFPGATTLDLL